MTENSIRKNMLYNTAGTILYYAAQWVMSVMVVRISGYEANGVLALAMSVTAAPAIISLFNVRSYQVSDIKDEFSDAAYVKSRWATNALSVIVCAVMILAGGYSAKKAFVILAFMVLKMVDGYADVYYGIEQKRGRLDYAGRSLIIRGIGLAILFGVSLVLTDNLLVAILIVSAWSLLVVLAYDRRAFPFANERSDRRTVMNLLIICVPLAVVAFLNNLSFNLPKIALEAFFGSEIMGYYSSVSSPTVVIQLAATTIFAPLVSPLTEKFAAADRKGFFDIIIRFAGITALLSVICIIGSALLGKPVLVLLFNEQIVPYVSLFVPIVLMTILLAVNAVLFSICTLVREIRPQYIIGIAGIAVSAVLSLTVVRVASMEGVVIAQTVSILVQIALQLLIISRKLRKGFGK